jgi:hypothetical protein
LCSTLAPEFQAAFKGVRATRIDVCLDVIGEDGTWDDLLKMSQAFAHARNMGKPELLGVEDEARGRTFYVGSRRESSVFLRVYEKGKAENVKRAKAGLEETADPNWIRLEFQHQKIEGHKKAAFGAMTPAELVCVRDWPRFWIASAAKVLGLTEAIGRAARHKAEFEPVVRTLEKTAEWGIRQYANTFMTIGMERVVERDFEGHRASATITPDALIAEAVDVFHEYLSGSGKADNFIREQRLDIEETPEERAQGVAERMQDERIRGMELRAKRRDELLRQVRSASKDKDGITAATESAVVASEALQEAYATRLDGWH